MCCCMHVRGKGFVLSDKTQTQMSTWGRASQTWKGWQGAHRDIERYPLVAGLADGDPCLGDDLDVIHIGCGQEFPQADNDPGLGLLAEGGELTRGGKEVQGCFLLQIIRSRRWLKLQASISPGCLPGQAAQG